MYVRNAGRNPEIHASPVDNHAAHSRERHQLDQASSEAEIARFRILYIITELLVNNFPEVLWVVDAIEAKDFFFFYMGRTYVSGIEEIEQLGI